MIGQAFNGYQNVSYAPQPPPPPPRAQTILQAATALKADFAGHGTLPSYSPPDKMKLVLTEKNNPLPRGLDLSGWCRYRLQELVSSRTHRNGTLGAYMGW